MGLDLTIEVIRDVMQQRVDGRNSSKIGHSNASYPGTGDNFDGFIPIKVRLSTTLLRKNGHHFFDRDNKSHGARTPFLKISNGPATWREEPTRTLL